MANKVDEIPDFKLNNLRGDFIPISQAIIMVARVVNKLVKEHNNIIDELR